jgi:uncharacterized membrane protein
VKRNNHGLLIAFVVLVALAIIGPVIAGTLFGPGGIWENTDNAPGWALGLMAAFIGPSMIATPAALVVGIILLVRWLGGGATLPSPDQEPQEEKKGTEKAPDEALEILRRRYAAGEISLEEYENMHQTLGGNHRNGVPRV